MAEKVDRASSLRRLKSKNIKTRRRAKKVLTDIKRKK
ncbi:putative metal homeostasis protein [Companilactobacillus hulinensis]|nr:putative metal homeostasis protein [Companilactobacillus hulinensis]